MRFELDDDQRDFAGALESLLAGADTVGAARAWADGDHAPGLKLWSRLAELGVLSLATEATPVEVAIAFEALGRHVVPGPWIESAAYLPALLEREVEGIATVAVPPIVPLALDADVADVVYVMGQEGLRLASAGDRRTSVDRTRRLFHAVPDASATPIEIDDPERGGKLAVLAAAAELLGAGERVLADTVTYVKQRRQFGREIGSYQAVKHALADVRIALDFARPLVFGAAVDLTRRDAAAAKVAAGDAAYRAARTGLQLHGAVGYTQELDLSLWLTRIQALVSAWGTPAYLRGAVLEELGA